MAKNKTTETQNSVADFVAAIPDEQRRKDISTLIDLMSVNSGLEPKMWGPAIIGFGHYHYKYESGHEGEAPLAGLASRVNAITLYLSTEFDQREELLAQLGKYKTSKVCIYVKKLGDIDLGVLAKMVQQSVAYSAKEHGRGC